MKSEFCGARRDTKRQVTSQMQTLPKWMMCLALIGASGAAMAQATYTVDFMADSERITGSITLAANSLGLVTPSEIMDWSFGSAAGDPTVFSLSSKDAGAQTICVSGHNCGLTATAAALTFTSISQTITEIVFDDINAGTVLALDGPGVMQGPSPGVLITASGGLSGYDLPLGTKIATRAPEMDSASAAAGLTLLLGSLAVMRGRRPRLRSAA